MSANFSLTQNTHHDGPIPQYYPYHQVKDNHPIRATCFHPTGQVYAVGTNSSQLKLLHYPTKEAMKDFTRNLDSISESIDSSISSLTEPLIAFQFANIHRGSLYCVGFNEEGNLLASGSNDQNVHLIQYDPSRHAPSGQEFELNMQSGTVRDLCFMRGGKSTLLVTGGAGDFEIYITDCNTIKPVQMLKGHESTIMTLHSWDESATFVSGSLDGTMLIWDLRTKRHVSTIRSNQSSGNGCAGGGDEQSAKPVGVVRVEPTGRLLVSGHQDGTCMFYDLRARQIIQLFKAHDDEIRTLNFSPKCYYLLTASYDHKVRLMDIQGDLTKKLPSVDIAELEDKIVQTAWHPEDLNFVTTSADGLATLWTIPVTN